MGVSAWIRGGLYSAAPLHARAHPDEGIPEARSRPSTVVIGGGVVGICAAWELSRKGCDVTLLENNSLPAEECSRTAAGGMQNANPLVTIDTWKDVFRQSLLPSFLTGRDPRDIRFFHVNWLQTATDPHAWRWLADFTYYSIGAPAVQEERQRAMLAFTGWAIGYLKDFMREKGLESKCGFNRNGALKLTYDEGGKGGGGGKALSMSSMEKTETLNWEETSKLEPSLEARRDLQTPSGSHFEPNASAANSERFTRELEAMMRREGKVKFKYGAKVCGFEEEGGKSGEGSRRATTGDRAEGSNSSSPARRITGIRLTSSETIPVDSETEVVIAAGAWSPRLLWSLGMYTPIYPMKGYCIPIQIPPEMPENLLPQRIIYDKYTYISRLGNQLRVTSIGEFAGWNTKPAPEVDDRLRETASRQLPHLQRELQTAATRCGLRPFSADGILLLGRVPGFSNLSINCGPGFNGWKTALGGARVLADVIVGDEEEKKRPGGQEATFCAESLSPQGRIRPSPVLSKLCLRRWSADVGRKQGEDSPRSGGTDFRKTAAWFW